MRIGLPFNSGITDCKKLSLQCKSMIRFMLACMPRALIIIMLVLGLLLEFFLLYPFVWPNGSQHQDKRFSG